MPQASSLQTSNGPTCTPSTQVAAARLLVQTLLRSPGARRRWQRHATRRRPGLHQAAVCQVLARHLWSTGQEPQWDTQLPRRLKDRVSRALSGTGLGPSTLRLFIDAFELDAATEDRLWAALWGMTDRERRD